MPMTDDDIFRVTSMKIGAAIEAWLGDENDVGISDEEFTAEFAAIAGELIRMRGQQR